MTKSKAFQYLVIFHPLEKEVKDNGAKSKIIVEPKIVLASDANSAMISASMDIPTEYKDKLDQVEIAIRPF